MENNMNRKKKQKKLINKCEYIRRQITGLEERLHALRIQENDIVMKIFMIEYNERTQHGHEET